MRGDWVIIRSALAMQEAARDKADYHQERVLWWEAEREDLVAADSDSEERLKECQYKLLFHKEQVQEYTGWVEFFKAMPDEQALQIHQVDFMYFDMAGLLRFE